MIQVKGFWVYRNEKNSYQVFFSFRAANDNGPDYLPPKAA